MKTDRITPLGCCGRLLSSNGGVLPSLNQLSFLLALLLANRRFFGTTLEARRCLATTY